MAGIYRAGNGLGLRFDEAEALGDHQGLMFIHDERIEREQQFWRDGPSGSRVQDHARTLCMGVADCVGQLLLRHFALDEENIFLC